MAAVMLPALPRTAKVRPRVLRFGNDLTPALGGPSQRLLRLGARFSIEVTLPPLGDACARAWLAARMRSEADGSTVRLALPQRAARPVGAVAGGTANAAQIFADFLPGGSGVIEPGMLFSFVADGRSYLHMVTTTAGGGIGVAPRLRVGFELENLEFENPVVEGYLDEVAWDLEALRFTGQSFVLTEER